MKVSPDRMRILSSEEHGVISNASGKSLWTQEARLINHTLKCVGPWVVLFKQGVRPNVGAPVPGRWIRRDAAGAPFVKLEFSKGTLVPSEVPSFLTQDWESSESIKRPRSGEASGCRGQASSRPSDSDRRGMRLPPGHVAPGPPPVPPVAELSTDASEPFGSPSPCVCAALAAAAARVTAVSRVTTDIPPQYPACAAGEST